MYGKSQMELFTGLESIVKSDEPLAPRTWFNIGGPAEYLVDVFPVALKSCMYKGSLYGLPDQTNGLCLFYNRELFREAGLDSFLD